MRTTLAAAGIALMLILAPTAAHADGNSGADGDLQRRVDTVLAEFPGGTQTGPNTIAWNRGTIELTLPAAQVSARSVGSCATGAYCAYSGTGLTGAKLTFTACGTTVSTAPLGTVRSLANARSSGSIAGKNSGGGVLTSVSAGAANTNTVSGITKVTCYS